MEGFAFLVLIFVGFIIWLVPIIKIASSSRTSGGEKAAWLILTIFIFWFTWVFYLLLAPLKNRTAIE